MSSNWSKVNGRWVETRRNGQRIQDGSARTESATQQESHAQQQARVAADQNRRAGQNAISSGSSTPQRNDTRTVEQQSAPNQSTHQYKSPERVARENAAIRASTAAAAAQPQQTAHDTAAAEALQSFGASSEQIAGVGLQQQEQQQTFWERAGALITTGVSTLNPAFSYTMGDGAARIADFQQTGDWKTYLTGNLTEAGTGMAIALAAAGLVVGGSALIGAAGTAGAATTAGTLIPAGATLASQVPVGVAANIGTTAVLGTMIAKAMSVKGLVTLAAITAGGYSLMNFGNWGQAEAPEPISYAMGKIASQYKFTKNPAYLALYNEAKLARDEFYNLSEWEEFALKTPLAPIVGIRNKIEGTKEGAIILDKYMEIQMMADTSGISVGEIENQEINNSYAANTAEASLMRIEAERLIQEIKTAGAEDRAALYNTSAIQTQQEDYIRQVDTNELENARALGDYWLSYFEKKAEILSQSEPTQYTPSAFDKWNEGQSSLNFGLL